MAVFFALAGAAALNVGLHYRVPIHAFAAGRVIAASVESLSTVPQLPFSFDDIVNYLSDTVGKAPHDRRSDYAVFESTAIKEIPLRISVTRQGSQMLLRFQVNDERGMDVARKFCKAPFFRSDESELLYALLSADEGIHCAISARFDVLCEYDMRPERTAISFFFSPPLRFCEVLSATP
jgi:hypothetical protein